MTNKNKPDNKLPSFHLHNNVFGNDWFALKAEAFARFFGTPFFLVGQTIVVLAWILANILGLAHFDLYPFILLNLAFSLQAAYAAPLILLAQTRQADRDKINAALDAKHREDIAVASAAREILVTTQSAEILQLLVQNTRLTELILKLNQRIETLATELHAHLKLNK
jgi:uncharacterized membrane protein